MAKAEVRYFAQGQASIVPPFSSKLLCRHPWRGQLPPDTFRLAEYNMLMPRDLLAPGVALLCASSAVMAAAAAEASVAAKVPAVAAVKSLPDRLDGWQPKRERR
jgi:hypothetical protein